MHPNQKSFFIIAIVSIQLMKKLLISHLVITGKPRQWHPIIVCDVKAPS